MSSPSLRRARARACDLPTAVVLAVWTLGATGCSDGDAGMAESTSSGPASSSDATSTTIGTTAPSTSVADSGSTEVEPSSSSGGSSDGSSSTDPRTEPVANDDVLFTPQEEVLVVDAAGVLANDVDPDGDVLTVVAADARSTAGATVVVDEDGGLVYAPLDGFWGPDDFGYTASDGTTEVGARVTVFVGPRRIELSEVAGGFGGFTIDGEVLDDAACSAVAGGGDMNGDGLADIAIGAPQAGPSGALSGKAYVVFGKADTTAVALADIAAEQGDGFALLGENADDLAGNAIALGDVDGDGVADVVVGATAATSPEGTGRAYVVYGKSDGTAVDLLDFMLGAAGGYTINAAAGGDGAGASLAVLGDLDGDGLGEVLIGAPFADRDAQTLNAGRVYLTFGRADSVPILLSDVAAGNGGFMALGDVTDDRAGQRIAAAGDVNGDGFSDFIVGTPSSDAQGAAAGRAYVVFARPDMTLDLRDAPGGSDGFVIDGATEDVLGSSVAAGGDVDGDGLADLIVGAQLSGEGGVAIVVFGRATTDPVLASDIVAGMGGGFAFVGDALDDAGRAVAAAGDLNGDGLADLLVGAPARFGGSRIGRAYVVFGKQDSDPVTAAEIVAGSDAGYVLIGEQVGDLAGETVAGVGDVDGDGVDDLVVGATQSNNQHHVGPGRCYVVFGVPTTAR